MDRRICAAAVRIISIRRIDDGIALDFRYILSDDLYGHFLPSFPFILIIADLSVFFKGGFRFEMCKFRYEIRIDGCRSV